MYWIFAPLQRDQLDDRAMQSGGVEFRRGAAFHVSQLRNLRRQMMSVRSNWPKFSALMRK